MSKDDEETLLLLCKAVESLGIILKHAKRRNEFIMKPGLKGCSTHLAISDGEHGLHRHVKNERARQKSNQKYTHIRDIHDREIIGCLLESLDEENANPSPHETWDDCELLDLDTLVSVFYHRLTRPPRHHEVWIPEKSIGDMFTATTRAVDEHDQIRHLSRMIAESKKLSHTGGFTKTEETEMWGCGASIGLDRKTAHMIMTIDETTVLDMSLAQLSRLVSNVSNLAGLDDLRGALRAAGENESVAQNPGSRR